MYDQINLNELPLEREESLKSIYRYSMFETMLYRSNLWMHTHRVLWMLEELLPLAEKLLDIDPERARILALVHDDVEMVTGDIQAGHKALMTKEELEAIEEEERIAVRKHIKKYPKEIHGYSYEDLLLDAVDKISLEAQIISYVDKLDGYCESLHEVFAGNISLLRAVILYTNWMSSFPHKYLGIVPLISSKESPLTFLDDRVNPKYVEVENYKHLLKPHTEETIHLQTDLPFYNEWKRLVLEQAPNGIQWLTEQREFLS